MLRVKISDFLTVLEITQITIIIEKLTKKLKYLILS